jgi:hypothetical protein
MGLWKRETRLTHQHNCTYGPEFIKSYLSQLALTYSLKSCIANCLTVELLTSKSTLGEQFVLAISIQLIYYNAHLIGKPLIFM